jgi:ferrous iron transport protein A
MKLNQLAYGQKARIACVEGATPELEAKLREVGFSEGDEVEMLAHGPFGGRTLAVRLNRSIIALRGAEAGMILVENVT